MAAIAGALYYPQAGIVNPTELAPIASIYLAVWVSIGGRGKLINYCRNLESSGGD